MTLSGNVSEYRRDTTDVDGELAGYNESYEYTYVPWVEDPANNQGICLLPEEFDTLREGKAFDYVIIEAGRCVNSFNDTIAALQGVRAASDDMICSKQ